MLNTADGGMTHVYDGAVYQKPLYPGVNLLLFSGGLYHDGDAGPLHGEAVPVLITTGTWVMSRLITAALSASFGFLLAACMSRADS